MRNFLALISALLLVACQQNPKFQVTGTIDGADGQMLYLEASALDGMHTLDSIRLKSDGQFSFSAEKTVPNPEFYTLRIGNQRLHFSIDSTETLSFKASMPKLVQTCSVSGSESAADISDICRQQSLLQTQIRELESSEAFIGEHYDSIQTLVTAYKQKMKDDYILKHPQRASAYFAVCQSVSYHNQLFQLFNPFDNRDDVKCYASVATAWDGRWPDADRTIQLCNMAVKGMENTAPLTSRQLEIDDDKISETGIIDVELPDITSTLRRLSDLRGQVVLLDFTMYGAQESAARTRAMRELYNKYRERGFEIYQISLDEDVHFWKFSCENLPWVCVHETDGRATRSYAVSTLPTFFLVNRDNEIVIRSENITNLEEALKSLL